MSTLNLAGIESLIKTPNIIVLAGQAKNFVVAEKSFGRGMRGIWVDFFTPSTNV
jgi:hypothetical protein